MKSKGCLIIAFALIVATLLIGYAVRVGHEPAQQPQNVHQQPAPYQGPILGGFSINTPIAATKAASVGVQVVFKYSQIPSTSSVLGKQFQALHMKVVDGFIWSYLSYYECHRTMTVKRPPPGETPYCQQDSHPDLDSDQAVLSAIATHLQEVKNNPLIIGYWVLDDWARWDAGSARHLLIAIHQLIQLYTPGLPAICGFGGSISEGSKYSWGGWAADNFSPQGCDRVGLYIYASMQPAYKTIPSSDTYNWSMSGLLPAIFSSLQKRGWNITREPLLGIVQAFGGNNSQVASSWVTPSAKNIETQSKSFCLHGSTGLVFYAWDDSLFIPATQTPMNSVEIQTGIQKGIAACKQYWSQNSY